MSILAITHSYYTIAPSREYFLVRFDICFELDLSISHQSINPSRPKQPPVQP